MLNTINLWFTVLIYHIRGSPSLPRNSDNCQWPVCLDKRLQRTSCSVTYMTKEYIHIHYHVYNIAQEQNEEGGGVVISPSPPKKFAMIILKINQMKRYAHMFSTQLFHGQGGGERLCPPFLICFHFYKNGKIVMNVYKRSC